MQDYCLERRCASTTGTQSPTRALLHARCELKVPLRAAQGASIPAVRPGRKTAEFITETLKNMSVLGSVFLGALAVRLLAHLLCICSSPIKLRASSPCCKQLSNADTSCWYAGGARGGGGHHEADGLPRICRHISAHHRRRRN